MSEPVGNSSRTPAPAVPSNAHKDRDAEPKPEQGKEREKIAKVVTGKVSTRKPSLWKRMISNIIVDDAPTIGEHILINVILPATKNLIRDTFVGGLDQALWGSARSRRPGDRGPVSSLRTQYDRVPAYSRGEPRRVMGRDARARHDFDEVVLETRTEAVDVIEGLIELVGRFGTASVSDLYDLVGVTGSFADRQWGWTDLITADVRQVSGGFLLDLPRPEPLR